MVLLLLPSSAWRCPDVLVASRAAAAVIADPSTARFRKYLLVLILVLCLDDVLFIVLGARIGGDDRFATGVGKFRVGNVNRRTQMWFAFCKICITLS